MDLQYANNSALADYNNSLKGLQDQDTATRQFVADRQLRARQDATAGSMSMPTSNTDLPTAAPTDVSAPAPAAPATDGTSPAALTIGRPTLAGPASPTMGVPAQPASGDNQQVMAPNASGPWAGRTAQPSTMDALRQEQQRNAAYRTYAAQQGSFDTLPPGQEPIPNIQAVLNASNAKLAALQQAARGGSVAQTSATAAANPPSVGPMAAPAKPGSPADLRAQASSDGQGSGPISADATQRAIAQTQEDIRGIQQEMSRPGTTGDTAGILQNALRQSMDKLKLLQSGAGQASPSAPQGQSAPAPAPVTPQGPGQTYAPGQGSDYNFDSDATHLQLLQTQQAYKIAQFKAQNAATGAERDAAMTQMMQLQQAGQGLHAQIFSNNMLQATRAVEAGNMGALGQMVQAMAQNTGTPLVIHQTGQGQYALFTPQGQAVTQPGSPADLAHMLYAKTAPAGRSLVMQNATAYNQAFNAAKAEADAKAGPAERLKNLEIQGKLQEVLATGNNELMKATLDQHGLKATPDPMGTGMYVYSPDRTTMMFIPTNAGGAPKAGLDFRAIPKQGIPQ